MSGCGGAAIVGLVAAHLRGDLSSAVTIFRNALTGSGSRNASVSAGTRNALSGSGSRNGLSGR